LLKNGWPEEADVALAVAICTPPTFTERDTSDQIALLEEAMGQQPFSPVSSGERHGCFRIKPP
jgi:hypothetical protein